MGEYIDTERVVRAPDDRSDDEMFSKISLHLPLQYHSHVDEERVTLGVPIPSHKTESSLENQLRSLDPQ